MGITLDKNVIISSIETAYNLLKDLGYEKEIIITDINPKKRTRSQLTTVGLQIDRDTMRIDQRTEIQIQNSPSIYIKVENLKDGTNYLIPKMTQRYLKKDIVDFNPEEEGEEQTMLSQPFLTNSIKKLFNLWIIKLKI